MRALLKRLLAALTLICQYAESPSIGRFEREGHAQSTAKKIEDLGLPLVVVPRHDATGEFLAVLTGPYGCERIETAIDWPKTHGFSDVRLVKNPLGNQREPSN